jgi:hypothetical protein
MSLPRPFGSGFSLEIYSLPKLFSGSPLTLALSHKGRGKFKERTFGNRYMSLK